MEQNVPKRRHITFRRRGIAQKKTYNIQNRAKVWNQESWNYVCTLNFSQLNQATYVQAPQKIRGVCKCLYVSYISLTSRNLRVTQCHKAEVWTVLTLAAHSVSSQKMEYTREQCVFCVKRFYVTCNVVVQREFPVRLLQKRSRVIDIGEVSEKVECFQVAERTSVCQQHLFCCPKQNRSSKCFSLTSRMSIVLDLFCCPVLLWTTAAPYQHCQSNKTILLHALPRGICHLADDKLANSTLGAALQSTKSLSDIRVINVRVMYKHTKIHVTVNALYIQHWCTRTYANVTSVICLQLTNFHPCVFLL